MRGVTLVEMVVVLAIISVLAGVAAAGAVILRPPPTDSWEDQVGRARAAAIRAGRRVVLNTRDGIPILLLPDGRVVGSGFDPLTGEVRDAPR